MSTWAQLANTDPELAAAGARLLSDPDGSPGVAFLATTTARGRPRIHPFIPLILDRELWAFVIHGPKQLDLDRNGQYAIHARLGPADEEFTISGAARRSHDPAHRAAVSDAMPYDDIDANHILYTFDVESALWTTWTTPTEPAHRSWFATAE
jgi:hypothetical protein